MRKILQQFILVLKIYKFVNSCLLAPSRAFPHLKSENTHPAGGQSIPEQESTFARPHGEYILISLENVQKHTKLNHVKTNKSHTDKIWNPPPSPDHVGSIGRHAGSILSLSIDFHHQFLCNILVPATRQRGMLEERMKSLQRRRNNRGGHGTHAPS